MANVSCCCLLLGLVFDGVLMFDFIQGSEWVISRNSFRQRRVCLIDIYISLDNTWNKKIQYKSATFLLPFFSIFLFGIMNYKDTLAKIRTRYCSWSISGILCTFHFVILTAMQLKCNCILIFREVRILL